MAFPTPIFQGSAVALVTPFSEGKVDYAALRKLVQLQLDGGTAAIVSCGTTGEPAALSLEEREKIIRETVTATGGKVPVICGTGSNCTAQVIENEKRFRGLGCSAQLVVTPYYNKTTQEGLYAHFMAIADHTELPIILYNVPGRTNVDISAETLGRLANTGRFAAIKEASSNIASVMEKIDAIDGKMAVYSGNDDLVYPLLAMGAKGVISVVSNVAPRAMADLCSLYFEGKPQESFALQRKILPLVRALFKEVSPIPCKYAMEKLGLCRGELRLPLVEASEGTKQAMDAALEMLCLMPSRKEADA